MKIGTINIDWFLKNDTTKNLILEKIKQQDFDFLIVTENSDAFNLSNNYFVYHSDALPLDSEYEHLDYGTYLKGKKAFRTSIFSKYPSIKKNVVQDAFTSVCHSFMVGGKEITIYGTIIGTWGILHQKTVAKKELLHFLIDSESFDNYQNVIVAGDLNTSFIVSENRELSQINSRTIFELQAKKINLSIVTAQIPQNIDHFLLSDSLNHVTTSVFIDETELKDPYHKGIAAIIE